MYVPIADFFMFLALFAVLGFMAGMWASRNAQRLDRVNRRNSKMPQSAFGNRHS